MRQPCFCFEMELCYDVRAVTKIYPGQTRPANDAIDLQIARGEIFGILGDNGAGKSTLIRQMVNLSRPTAGRIELFGKPVHASGHHVALNVGYMPQDTRSIINQTPAEALFAVAHLRGLSKVDATREADVLLQKWELTPFVDVPGRRLSGGQRRMMYLAIAVAGHVPVLVLDEPTNELDPLRRQLVWRNLREQNAQSGTTVIFITHDALEAEKALQRVGIMRAGRFVLTGRPSDLKARLFNTLRLELGFDPGRPPHLPSQHSPTVLDAGRWLLYVKSEEAAPLIEALRSQPLVDFKLHSATLEDLYLHVVTQAEAGG